MQQVSVMVGDEMMLHPQMHRDKMVKEKKKKKKSKKNKKHHSDSSDSESEEKKKEKLKKVRSPSSLAWCLGWLVTPGCDSTLNRVLRPSGAGRGRQAYKADGGDNAAGREEEAVQQPAGSQGADWGGDGGLPHEALPTRWSHGLLPGPVRSLVFIFTHRPPPRDPFKDLTRHLVHSNRSHSLKLWRTLYSFKYFAHFCFNVMYQ